MEAVKQSIEDNTNKSTAAESPVQPHAVVPNAAITSKKFSQVHYLKVEFYFSPFSSQWFFWSPWKHQKTFGFDLSISSFQGIKREYCDEKGYVRLFKIQFYPFLASVPFLYPLKALVYQKVSDVFRG